MKDKNLTPESKAVVQTGATRRSRLARLLGIYEKFDDLAIELAEAPPRRQRERLQARKRRLRDELLAMLAEGPPRGLEALLRPSGSPLRPTELALVLRLLHQRLAAEEAYVSGRELLWFLCDSNYEVLEAMPLLRPDGALQKSGLLRSFVEEDVESDDLLSRAYGLSSAAYRRLTRPSRTERRRFAIRPLVDGIDHFLEVAALTRIAERRAACAFSDGLWRETLGEPAEDFQELDRRFDRARRGLERRLAASRDADRFPLRRLQIDFQLGEVEILMVAALAAREALSGQPTLDPIDLLRLVSRSPRDLLRKRGLLGSESRLVAQDIIRVDDGLDRDSLTGEVALAPWVLDRLVGGPLAHDARIGSDEKIDFHDFLSRLDGSDDFYDRL